MLGDMALRDKLRNAAAPFVQSGERIQAVFMAQTGPSPYRAALLGPLGLAGVTRYIVATTDRAHYVLATAQWQATVPTTVSARLPRHRRIGPVSGAWARSTLLGERTWIHRRFHADVAQADSLCPAVGSTSRPTTPAGWYPDPDGPGSRRYWDGGGWTGRVSAG